MDEEDMLQTEANLLKPDAGGAEGGTTIASAAQPDEVGDLIAPSDKPSSPLPDPILPLPPVELQQPLAAPPTQSIQPNISHEPEARPKRNTRPPDRLGYLAPTKSHGSCNSQRKGTHYSKSAPSQLTGYAASKHSSRLSGSYTSRLSDTQHCILGEKAKRDELEERRKQRQEEEELDEKCALIDRRLEMLRDRRKKHTGRGRDLLDRET
ncbi:hypothetical protein ABVT39_000221 [Epinephelus coioides]